METFKRDTKRTWNGCMPPPAKKRKQEKPKIQKKRGRPVGIHILQEGSIPSIFFEYIKIKGATSISDLAEHFGLSRYQVRWNLLKLRKYGMIETIPTKWVCKEAPVYKPAKSNKKKLAVSDETGTDGDSKLSDGSKKILIDNNGIKMAKKKLAQFEPAVVNQDEDSEE